MKRIHLIGAAGLAALFAVTTVGCQTFATQRHDRAIEQYAQDSGFPSPSDVGYVEHDIELAGTEVDTRVR